jgi:hypothetical protein
MGSHVIAIEKMQLHFHIDGLHVRGASGYSNACANEWRPDIDEAQHPSLKVVVHGKSSSCPQHADHIFFR